MTRTLYDGDTFTHEGHTFRVNTERDEQMNAPWEEHDGHGPVSKWTERDPEPGERVLATASHGHYRRYYDFAEAERTALADGWGSAGDEGLSATKKASQAAEADFEYLRAWCNDEWCWIVVTVTLLDADEDDTPYSASIGGVEDPQGTYLSDLARELADEILGEPELVSAAYYDMEGSK